MRNPCLTACAATVLLATLAPRAATPADAPEANLKTQTVFIKGVNVPHPGVPVELVQLPLGKVTLADANGKPTEHAVKPVWIARYETRWDEYNVFWRMMDVPGGERSSRRRTQMPYLPPHGGEPNLGAGYPADCVTLLAAKKYCAWLSQNTGKKFRLPTEAEWEYACRAGGGPVRLDADALGKVAWFKGNANEERHPVGKKQPNAWGLYDMLGNVGEFVIRDPKDEKGVLAGGAYNDDAKDVHSGAREPYSPAWQRMDPYEPKNVDWLDYDSAHHVGFRVVMEE